MIINYRNINKEKETLDLADAVITSNGSSLIITFPDENKAIQSIEFTLSEFENMEDETNAYYYTEDIRNYFASNADIYDIQKIFDDKKLMNMLLSEYSGYRRDADGGDIEDTMHWTDCLAMAIDSCEDQLEKYRITDPIIDTTKEFHE